MVFGLFPVLTMPVGLPQAKSILHTIQFMLIGLLLVAFLVFGALLVALLAIGLLPEKWQCKILTPLLQMHSTNRA